MCEFKQYIVINRGLDLSLDELLAKVSRVSMAWLKYLIRDCAFIPSDPGNDCVYADLTFDRDFYDAWMSGRITTEVLTVDFENEMLEFITKLEDAGFSEGGTYYVIRDNGLFKSEFVHDDTSPQMACIGFRPTNNERIIDTLKDYQLFR